MTNSRASNGPRRPSAFARKRRDEHAAGLFVVEKKVSEQRWAVVSTHRSAHAAQDRAWETLTRHGGDVRIRQGPRVVAEGTHCANTASQPASSER